MSKGPGLFSDIGKKSKDLLNKDYSYDQKFVVATTTNAGLAFTSSAVKKGGISSGDVALQYKYNNKHVIDLKVDTESNITATFTGQEFSPSVKTIATVKFPEYNGGKFEVQYVHDHAAVSTAIASNQSPAVDVSATFGTPRFAFGAEAGYETKLATFTKYNAGVSVMSPDYNVSFILADKGDTLRASYVHYFGEPKKSAGVAEIYRRFSTNENTFTVGGSHAFDQLTSVKAKLNNHGKLGALFQHEVKPKSILTISGEIDTKALDKNPRFGLSLSLKP